MKKLISSLSSSKAKNVTLEVKFIENFPEVADMKNPKLNLLNYAYDCSFSVNALMEAFSTGEENILTSFKRGAELR